MTKNDQKIEKNHQRFIEEVCRQGKVWTLKSPDVYAISSSLNYADQQGQPLPMLCTWSNKGFAIACAKKEWGDFEPEAIELSSFMEDWCVGMDDDGLMVGINFTQNMEGIEVEPFMLILELVTELKRTNKKITFQHFNGLADIKEQIREVLAFRG
ncbi:MAG: DUF2750 domain-containing protein [Flammeovirgaceae bacterium]